LFFTITSLYAQSADDAPFVLVTDYSTLEDGDEILLVNEKDSKAMGKESSSSNKTILAKGVNIENHQIEAISNEVQIVTLEGENGAWYLKVDKGYLVLGYDNKRSYYLSTQDNKASLLNLETKMNIITKTTDDAIICCYNKKNNGDIYISYDKNLFLCNNNITNYISNIKIYRKLKNIVTVDYDENDEGIKAKLSENLNKENVTVNLKRNFKADGGWYSLCLPFDVSADNMKKIFGESVSVQEFASASGDEGVLMVNFTSTENGIKAGKPYLIKPSKDAENPVFKRIVITKDEPEIVEQAGYKFIGIFAPFELKAGDKTCRFLNGADGTKLDYPSVTENLKGTRAYFKFPSSSAQSAASAVTDDVASVTFVVNGNKSNKTKIYKLDGTELNENQLVKGIYIVGDKKVLIK
jgi:hypothetical protein